MLRLPLVVFIFTLVAGVARAAEEHTTWRSGDAVIYAVGCHDREIMEAASERGDSRFLQNLVRSDICFVYPAYIRARLVEWLSGPYMGKENKSYSLWKIVDIVGDVEYINLYDHTGPNKAIKWKAL